TYTPPPISPAHPDRPALPTRRSSDLGRTAFPRRGLGNPLRSLMQRGPPVRPRHPGGDLAEGPLQALPAPRLSPGIERRHPRTLPLLLPPPPVFSSARPDCD